AACTLLAAHGQAAPSTRYPTAIIFDAGAALRRSIVMPMNAHTHIALQSSYGDFDSAFRKRLPALEKAMIDQGLHPSDFVIAKDLAQNPRLPIAYRPNGN